MAYWQVPAQYHANVKTALAAVAAQFQIDPAIEAAHPAFLNVFTRVITGPADMPEYGDDDQYGLEIGDCVIVRHDLGAPATVPAMAAADGISVFKVVDETAELINFTYLCRTRHSATRTSETRSSAN